VVGTCRILIHIEGKLDHIFICLQAFCFKRLLSLQRYWLTVAENNSFRPNRCCEVQTFCINFHLWNKRLEEHNILLWCAIFSCNTCYRKILFLLAQRASSLQVLSLQLQDITEGRCLKFPSFDRNYVPELFQSCNGLGNRTVSKDFCN